MVNRRTAFIELVERTKELAAKVFSEIGDNGRSLRTLETRAAKLSTNEITDWIDTALSGIGREILDFSRGGRPEVQKSPQECLTDAISSMLAVDVMLIELQLRVDEHQRRDVGSRPAGRPSG